MEKLGKYSLVLNILLLGAIIYLFTQVSGVSGKVEKLSKGEGITLDSAAIAEKYNKEAEVDTIDLSVKDSNALQFPIAYIHADSINKNYKFVAYMTKQLEGQARYSQNKLDKEIKKFQDDIQSFANAVQVGTYSQEQAKVKEQEFMKREKALMQKKQKYEVQFGKRNQDLQIELQSNIRNYLDENSDKFKYSYVLIYGGAYSNVVYANTGLDITDKLITALNKDFDKSQAGKKKKKK